MTATTEVQTNQPQIRSAPSDQHGLQGAASALQRFEAKEDLDRKSKEWSTGHTPTMLTVAFGRRASPDAAQQRPLEFLAPAPIILRNRKERRGWLVTQRHVEASAMLLEKWLGQVQSTSSNGFSAELHDQIHAGQIDQAEFSLNEIDSSDQPLVKRGALFYWYIYRHRGGKVDSILWFRRAGRIARAEFKRNLEKADDIWRTFGWADASNTPGY